MPDLITFGETCAVFVAREIGRMRYCREFTLRPGGAEATVAVGARRLGIEAAWISALGDDELGHYIRGLMAAEEVDISRVTMISGQPTGLFLRERLPAGAARHFYYRRGSAFSRYTPEMLDADFITGAKILHVTGINPALSENCAAASWRAMEIARSAGSRVSFDPNVRLALWDKDIARTTLEPYFAAADLVLPGLEDMQMLYGRISTDEALRILADLGCREIVLKVPDGDVIVVSGGETTRIPIDIIANPVDVMGAGDAFAAGCLAGLIEGQPLPDAARLGAIVAGLAVQMPGNIESLPTRAEVARKCDATLVWNR